jgi:putative membrane protein
MTQIDLQAAKKYNKWIVILSVVIPVVVAILFGVNLRELGFDIQPLTFLPPIYAGINAVTALVLVMAFMAIKNKKINLHKRLMQLAIGLSLSFLLMYVAYHMTSDSTKYGGEGAIKYIYFVILITHILMSIIVIPFVLITYVRGITNNIEKHKKIAKITFPLWLYVAVSGVVVYIMISPYYA